MEQQFNRSIFLPATQLLAGFFFGINAFLQFSMGHSPLGLINIIACIFFIGVAIWGFSTPILKIDEAAIHYIPTIFTHKKVLLSDILSIDFSNEKKVDIILNDNQTINIPHHNIPKKDIDIIREYLSLLPIYENK